jgi:hypothetical protein
VVKFVARWSARSWRRSSNGSSDLLGKFPITRTPIRALEAQRRGHALFHYLPEHPSLRQGRLYARVRTLAGKPREPESLGLIPSYPLKLGGR